MNTERRLFAAVNLKCTLEDKAAWKQAAEAEGLTLSAWIIKNLNKVLT